MGKALLAFALSVGFGVWFSFFNVGIGVVMAVSVIGAFIIYQNEKNRKE